MSEQLQSANGNGGFLGTVERVGNKLPDPAVLFIALLFIVWERPARLLGASSLLATQREAGYPEAGRVVAGERAVPARGRQRLPGVRSRHWGRPSVRSMPACHVVQAD